MYMSKVSNKHAKANSLTPSEEIIGYIYGKRVP